MTAASTPIYAIPQGVQPVQAGGRPALTTRQGGKIIVDDPILELWQAAAGRSLDEIAAWCKTHEWDVSEAASTLACLVQAGLLSRNAEPEQSRMLAAPDADEGIHKRIVPEPGSSPIVSVVIVSYNSRAWLPGCLDSLNAQTYSPLEIIVIDNASTDDSADWLAANHPTVRLERISDGGSLARALNIGIRIARGEYILLLNPDVEVAPEAVGHLVSAARDDPSCAAVAARLRFLWAPSFLNGIGNFVGAFSWGADSALGYLDLGQFDDWGYLASACFAAALIPAEVIRSVGMIDEGFPMYYEDSEWCYRARLLGFQVRAASRAIIYHAFSGRVPSGQETGLAAAKLRHVAYGRLRFVTKLLGDDWLKRFRRRYQLEDLAGRMLALARRQPEMLQAYRQAWQDYHAGLPDLLVERQRLQSHRACSDPALFELQHRIPLPLIWRGLPLLTRDVIVHHYLPWLSGPGRARFPEMAVASTQPAPPTSFLRRASAIRRDEGLAALLHRLARLVQWRLMQP